MTQSELHVHCTCSFVAYSVMVSTLTGHATLRDAAHACAAPSQDAVLQQLGSGATGAPTLRPGPAGRSRGCRDP